MNRKYGARQVRQIPRGPNTMVLQKYMKAFRIVANIAVAGVLGLYVVAVATRMDRFSWDLVTARLISC